VRPISYYKIGYQGETKLLTQLRFIHNRVIKGIQWMMHWWVLGHGVFGSLMPIPHALIAFLSFLGHFYSFFQKPEDKIEKVQAREREREREREIRSWVISCSSFQLSQKRISVFFWPNLRERERALITHRPTQSSLLFSFLLVRQLSC
jgi:hypothetical protein